jgi:biotin transport system substrate-specific component
MTAITAGFPDRRHQIIRQGATVVLGVAVMTLAAKTQIPFWPVPVTLQTLAVMAFAVGLGPRMATAIFAAYIMTGLSGMPVFAGSPERGLGLAYLIGPTGGYLLGCLAASWLIGVMASGKALLGRIAAMLAGTAAIYGCGLAVLAAYVPAGQLLPVGVAPFVLGDLLKIALVAAGSQMIPLVRKGRGRASGA